MAKKVSIKKFSVLEKISVPTQKVKIEFELPKALSFVKKVNLRRFLPKNSTQVLVALLIVASFLLGYLVNEVKQKNQIIANQGAPIVGDTAQGAPAPGTKVDVSVGNFPIKGNKDAKVTIIAFADFRCPFCAQFFTDTEPQIFKDYVDTGKVKYTFRNFAFLGPASTTAANAAECANDQGKFWEYYEYLYKNQPAETDTSMYNSDTLTQGAVSLGMDGNKFKTCLDSNTHNDNVNKDMTDGQAAGVNGTPTFFVNGISLVGAQPYSAFQTLIDQELAKAK